MTSNTTVELWTLYAFGFLVTVLRTYARITAVGIRELRADDYLIWIAILIYTSQTTLGYHVGISAHGLANNGMTDAQRSSLSPDNPEYTWRSVSFVTSVLARGGEFFNIRTVSDVELRVVGSKIQLAGWTLAPCLLWTLKLCVTFFYYRLTNGLGTYQKRIHIAMVLIATSFVAVMMTVFLACRPYRHYWQISPDPGNSCQPAISKPIIWVSFVLNVSTDIFLFSIPIPMLWKSSLQFYKKVAATSVLSAGLLTIICATLKSIYVIVDPVNGGELAAAWGTRETFIAVVTTNLPMIFPLFKVWLAPFLPSTFRSNRNNKAYKTPGSGFVTIGGGGASSHTRKTPRNGTLVSTNMTFNNESEETMIKDNGVKMQHLNAARGTQGAQGAIIVSKQVSVTTEELGDGRQSGQL